MQRHLQLPDQLAASLDLATGTGKSYVLYGVAAILLAEGAVDRVLVLCPSTTIEAGLLEKFTRPGEQRRSARPAARRRSDHRAAHHQRQREHHRRQHLRRELPRHS